MGRDAQVARLGSALAEAAGGRGQYLALVGEPGIGKTRLAETIADQVSDRFEVAWGRCFEVGGTPALWPWIEVARSIGVADPIAGASEQFEVFDGFARALQQTASKKPLLVVLDDIHAADRSSLLLLQFVVRQLRRWHCAVLATYRDVEARLRGDSAEVLSKAAREGDIIPLARLGADDVATLATEAGRADVAARVFATTEGNPLFVGELLRFAGDRGLDSIPDGVRAVIGERMRLLTPDVHVAVQAAAVIGRDFDAVLLGELLQCDLPAVRGWVAEAVRGGVVSQLAPDRYRFDHVRIRDVLYEEVAAARAAELHRAAATALTRLGGEPAAIAAHWGAVGPTAANETIAATRRAADEATRRKAFDEAADQLARAVDAAPHAGLAIHERLSLALDASAAAIRAGRTDDGLRTCERAFREARDAKLPELVARAALVYGQVYRFGKSDPVLVALLREALAAQPDGDSKLRAQLLGRLAGALQPANDMSIAVRAGRDAIEMARRVGDLQTLMSVLVSAGSALQDVVDAAERVSLSEQLVDLAAAADDWVVVARGALRLAIDHIELGNLAAADARFAEYDAMVVEQRNPRSHWPPALFRAMRADIEGRHAEADEHVAQAERLAKRAEDAGAATAIEMHRICTAIVLDDPALLRAAEARLPQVYHPLLRDVCGAVIALRLGKLDEARVTVAALGTEFLASWASQASAGTLVGEMIAAAGSRDQQQRMWDVLLPMADGERVGVWGMTAMTCLGPVARSQSLLARALGRSADADRYHASAVATATRMGHVPLLARLERDRGATPVAPPLVAPPTPEPVATTSDLSIERDGDSWVLRLEGEQTRLRDSRGLQIIAELVGRIGDDIHVLDLSGSGGGTIDTGDAGEALDKKAIEKYRARIRDLTGEIEDAEDAHDLGRAEKLREELEALEDEISRAVGIGGRARRTGSAGERARINVQRRIKAAITQAEQYSPALANHLTRSIRTGSFCSYAPRRDR